MQIARHTRRRLEQRSQFVRPYVKRFLTGELDDISWCHLRIKRNSIGDGYTGVQEISRPTELSLGNDGKKFDSQPLQKRRSGDLIDFVEKFKKYAHVSAVSDQIPIPLAGDSRQPLTTCGRSDSSLFAMDYS
jgi:hypothetical protein